MHIEKNILDKVNEWLTPTFDQKTQDEIKEMMTSSPKNLEESFYKNLEFGTGGMRGIMGVGTNRINKYTLGKNTQGLSDYLKKSFSGEQLKVAIAYDCRHNSDTLAKVVADVFSANGIHVYLFSEMRQEQAWEGKSMVQIYFTTSTLQMPDFWPNFFHLQVAKL